MPTIFWINQYRFFFYSNDKDEPIHVHIQREDWVAKFWVDPVRLQEIGGFKRHEINEIQRMVVENQTRIVEAWNEYFHG